MNWFVMIHRHLTKVSAQKIQCIIFERNELSITIYSMVTPSSCVGDTKRVSKASYFSWVTRRHYDNKGAATVVLSVICYLNL